MTTVLLFLGFAGLLGLLIKNIVRADRAEEKLYDREYRLGRIREAWAMTDERPFVRARGNEWAQVHAPLLRNLSDACGWHTNEKNWR